MQTGADWVCWGGWFCSCAWLASQSTSLWLESVLWDGSRLDRTEVISLVPVWLLWIWDMCGWLPGSLRCWRYLLGHLSAVQHSLSVHGQVCCQDPQPCMVWMLHLWSLAAHEPLLSSMASGLPSDQSLQFNIEQMRGLEKWIFERTVWESWAKKEKINAYFKTMKVFFDLACMSTYCRALLKPKYEPFITHNRGTLHFYKRKTKRRSNHMSQYFIHSRK